MRSVQVSHIVLSTQELADVLLEHLQSFDDQEAMLKSFAKQAKKYSACGSRNQGGSLGYLEVHTSAPELYQAVMKAESWFSGRSSKESSLERSGDCAPGTSASSRARSGAWSSLKRS